MNPALRQKNATAPAMNSKSVMTKKYGLQGQSDDNSARGGIKKQSSHRQRQKARREGLVNAAENEPSCAEGLVCPTEERSPQVPDLVTFSP
jgi:hypothetical protein